LGVCWGDGQSGGERSGVHSMSLRVD
jgi:hypothetical protein